MVVVDVGDDRQARVLGEISQPPQVVDVATFGLFVDGDVQGLTDQREADWHDVRSAACVGGREMRHSLSFEEASG